jgi:hypothetical protein
MIKKNGNEITEIKIGKRVITYVKQKMHVLYEAILSCFGKGYWVNDAPFLNNDGWVNN